MSVAAYVALGANSGDRLAALRRAAAALDDHPDLAVSRASSIWESPAVPPSSPEDPAYLNAVLAIQSRLSSSDLLELLMTVEADLGRVRAPGGAGAPRVIDLDLLTFGDEVCDRPELTLPHPRMLVREFVLRPLVELAPDEVRWTDALLRLDTAGSCVRRPSMSLGVS